MFIHIGSLVTTIESLVRYVSFKVGFLSRLIKLILTGMKSAADIFLIVDLEKISWIRVAYHLTLR